WLSLRDDTGDREWRGALALRIRNSFLERDRLKSHLRFVVPAKAGTQGKRRVAALDPRFRGGDEIQNSILNDHALGREPSGDGVRQRTELFSNRRARSCRPADASPSRSAPGRRRRPA